MQLPEAVDFIGGGAGTGFGPRALTASTVSR